MAWNGNGSRVSAALVAFWLTAKGLTQSLLAGIAADGGACVGFAVVGRSLTVSAFPVFCPLGRFCFGE